MVHRMAVSSPTARWAQREPGPEEWHPGRVGHDVRVVLQPYRKPILTLILVPKPKAAFHFCLSISILDILPTDSSACHLSS